MKLPQKKSWNTHQPRDQRFFSKHKFQNLKYTSYCCL